MRIQWFLSCISPIYGCHNCWWRLQSLTFPHHFQLASRERYFKNSSHICCGKGLWILQSHLKEGPIYLTSFNNNQRVLWKTSFTSNLVPNRKDSRNEMWPARTLTMIAVTACSTDAYSSNAPRLLPELQNIFKNQKMIKLFSFIHINRDNKILKP